MTERCEIALLGVSWITWSYMDPKSSQTLGFRALSVGFGPLLDILLGSR